MLKKGDHRIM